MSGSGNTGAVLGASTTAGLGAAMLPVTGGINWVVATATAVVAGGLVIIGFQVYAAYVGRQN